VAAMRVRAAYRKGPEIRFTSHLDVLRIFIRAFRRARIRLALSQGFHAHPRLSPGPPLPLGYTGKSEYLDFEVFDNIPGAFERVLNPHLPKGLEFLQHALVPEKTPALDGSINLAAYRVDWDGAPEVASLKPKIESFLARNSCRIRREEKEVDIRLSVVELSAGEEGLNMLIRLGTPASARVKEVLDSLFESYEEPPKFYRVERTALLIERQGRRLTPMEVIQHA
jgi:radical SAM-linked protein